MSGDSQVDPLLSVIVCTYNRAALLPGCLESLVAQSLGKQHLEVIVVDNNSTDATHEIAESFAGRNSNFRVVMEQAQGLSHARNRGLREASGRYVAYIDDDAKAAPDWCERILEAFVAISPQPAAVGGKVQPFYETTPPAWFTEDFELRTWGDEAHFLQPPQAQFGFSGSNMIFRRSLLEEYGGFSADYGMVGTSIGLGEETELFSRIYKLHPWFWYDPAIRVFHWTPARNMKVFYRFQRAFRSGKAVAHLHNVRFFSYIYLRKVITGIIFLLIVPCRLIIARGRFMTNVVRKCEELGSRLGYLFGGVFHQQDKN